ncbi:hypothetical protein KDK_36560 [Dictyobacter kobayashii]|uniref:Uncharacterized protein n=1 Tax=Dictyobacter kobayashii TaxID=2014872 RepID=A0A402AL53_9CHLR|nr:hypothetical protein KDK_36560 [Dictyobacter kobayashii]
MVVVLPPAAAGREEGMGGGTAPGPPVKGLAAPCIPAPRLRMRKREAETQSRGWPPLASPLLSFFYISKEIR